MKNIKKLPLYVVMCVLLIGLIWMIIDRDEDISERENRTLAGFPKISLESVFGGRFMDEFETYLTDQFPARDFCVSVKAQALRLAGYRRIGSVYIADDDFLIAKEAEYDSSDVRELIAAINNFTEANEDVDVSLMLVPNTVESLSDKLPYFKKSRQKQTVNLFRMNISDAVEVINVFDVLCGEGAEQYYYKTDHHWTSRGAFEAFKEYERKHGVNVDENAFEFNIVTDSFNGTQSSNSGIFTTSDSIEICEPKKSQGSYVVEYVNEGIKTASLFDGEKLSEKDKYLVFMGGNYAEVRIDTSVKNGKTLLIVKDSYGNCMVPMFTGLYERIVVIDPRYYTGTLQTQVWVSAPDEILFLYNINSIVEDKSLKDVLKIEEF